MRANLLWREWAESRKACDSSSPQSRHWPSGCAKNAAIMSKRRDAVKMNITQLLKCVLPAALASAITLLNARAGPANSDARLSGLAHAPDDNDKETVI
jgi:hypothetical protein